MRGDIVVVVVVAQPAERLENMLQVATERNGNNGWHARCKRSNDTHAPTAPPCTVKYP